MRSLILGRKSSFLNKLGYQAWRGHKSSSESGVDVFFEINGRQYKCEVKALSSAKHLRNRLEIGKDEIRTGKVDLYAIVVWDKKSLNVTIYLLKSPKLRWWV